MSNPYALAVSRPQEILKVLARTPIGRNLLERVSPFLARGKIKLADYPDSTMKKLRETIPAGHPVGACLIWDDAKTRETGTIFLDLSSPVGVLAPYLVHEIICLSPGNRESTELEALRTQIRFSEELRERDLEFDEFLKANLMKAKLLHDILAA